MMARVFGICGHSGSGKTTLIEALLGVFSTSGLRVNVIKHSHHDVMLEPSNKDSARFRAHGAAEVLLVSPYRFAIFHELRAEPEPTLAEQLLRLSDADLTLVEGFKSLPIPKLEVFRPSLNLPGLYLSQQDFCAVATDISYLDAGVPVLDLNSPLHIGQFILEKSYAYT